MTSRRMAGSWRGELAMGPGPRSEGGFSLVEVMVAVLILTAVMVPLMESYIQSSRAADSSKKQLTAAFLAMQYLEESRGLGYSELASLPEAGVEGFPGFSRLVEVGPGPEPGVKTISVTVIYGGAGDLAYVTLTTDYAWR